MVRTFRNIGRMDWQPGRRVNVIVGDNGQGKTSLLEAVYLVATTRSFRTERVGDVVQQGAEGASVRGWIADETEQREQAIGVTRSERALTVNGGAAPKVASYAVRTPVVVFHAGDLELVTGGAERRRRLLDRLGLFAEPESAVDRGRYSRACRERQRILMGRGEGARELEGYEGVMAQSGARITAARRRAASALERELGEACEEIGAGGLGVEIGYIPGGSEKVDEVVRVLRERRGVDARRRGCSYGPQKDELEVRFRGLSLRKQGSQGQQRLVVFALKMAEFECVRQARGTIPMVLLDDVASELDAKHEGLVHGYVSRSRGQVFLSGTRPMVLMGERAGEEEVKVWKVEGGVVSELGSGRVAGP